jgi:hypothetical protein
MTDKAKNIKRSARALFAFSIVGLFGIGYATWMFADFSNKYGSTSDDVSVAPTTEGATNYTVSFPATVSSSSLAPANSSNTYNLDLLQAKLSYTENSSHPLNDNFQLYDAKDPIGENSPSLTETESGRTFQMENNYLDSINSNFSSTIFYGINYSQPVTDDMSGMDAAIKNKLDANPLISAPRNGYSSEYKIYSISDTGQTKNVYRVAVSRDNKTTETGKRLRYRLWVFFRVSDKGSTYLAYRYANLSAFAWSNGSDTTLDFPTIEDQNKYTAPSSKYTTSYASLKYTFSKTDSDIERTGTSNIYLYDGDFSSYAGQNPHYDLADYSKTSSDFDDTTCKNYVKQWMSDNVIKTSTTMSCGDDDVISDTDLSEDGTSNKLGMDAGRYPFMKTVLARYELTSGGNTQYLGYRVFYFFYLAESGKLRVINNGTAYGTSTNYNAALPTVYLYSIDDDSPSSLSRNSYSMSYIRAMLTYDRQSTVGGTSKSVSENLVTRFDDHRFIYTRVDTLSTQDDFNAESIISARKSSNVAGFVDGSSYTAEILSDYDEVSKYVTNIADFPYLKFILTRLHYSDGTYGNFGITVALNRFNGTNGAIDQVLYTTPSGVGNLKRDYWQTWTIHKTDAESNPSLISGFNDPSILRMTATYYTSVSGETSASKDISISFTGNDSNSNNKYVTSSDETAEQKAQMGLHLNNTYTIYNDIDLTKPHSFSYYIQNGNYCFTNRFFVSGHSSSLSAIEYTYKAGFSTSISPKYGSYTSTSRDVLSTASLPTTFVYQGYRLYQMSKTEYFYVIHTFKNSSTGEERSYAFPLSNTGAVPKTYFKTFLDENKSSSLSFVYKVHFIAKTQYAKANAASLLKGYNFVFSLSRSEESVVTDATKE